ncbi:MAG: Uncharacterized protein AUK63_1016 [bacterium P3]|nr:MAG: Uncharacterized protein AUK64_2066 [bacterium P201]KWW30364.1 MAG: Uncharacterized protein AUK63_1016 [bacterium P3]KWW32859.1 MAG: Uncharacterized protein F083_2597 [bacterium F083]
MRIRLLKLQNWLVLSLLSLLGFGACRSTKDLKPDRPVAHQPGAPARSEIVLMYGVPTANYQIKGRVVNGQGHPVQGIQLLRLERGMEATPDALHGDPDAVRAYIRDNAVTSVSDGTFHIRFSERPADTLRLLVRDVDGAENGVYRNQIFSLSIAPEDYSGGQGWFSGTVSKEVTVRMEELR